MELNRAQQLMDCPGAMAKFRRDRRILNNVHVAVPEPIKVATTVEGIMTMVLTSPLFKEVMARCDLIFMQVSVNFVSIVLAVNALLHREQQALSIKDFLNVYNMVRLKRYPETNLHTRNHYLGYVVQRSPKLG